MSLAIATEESAAAVEMKMRSLSLVVALIAGLCVLSGCFNPSSSESTKTAYAAPPAEPKPEETPVAVSPPEGTWIAAQRADLRQTASAVGSFSAHRVTTVGPQVSGRVVEVLADVGDSVTKGQELVRLDTAFFRIETAQSAAAVESARVAWKNAETNFNRMKSLWEVPKGQTPSVSQKMFDDAQSQYDGALAQMKAAEAAHAFAQERMKESVVRAPFNGVVSKRLVHPGQMVTSAPVTSLLEIQEVESLDLEFTLPQNLLSLVKKGTPISFAVEGIPDSSTPSSVDVIYPDVDPSTRSFRCRAVIENKDRLFRPGLLAQVQVILRELKGALVVPAEALSQSSTGRKVQVQENGHPVSRAVEVGLIDENQAEILTGLQEGDLVLVPQERR